MPLYPFACTQCDGEEDVLLSVEEYEMLTHPDGHSSLTYLSEEVQVCSNCEGVLIRIFTSFTIRGGTENTRVMGRTEDQLILSMEKQAAFEKGGETGVENWRNKRREKTHDKTGRRIKSWRRNILGDD